MLWLRFHRVDDLYAEKIAHKITQKSSSCEHAILDPSKSAGPDGIPTFVLKSCATEISPILQVIFTPSLNEGTLPNDWLKENITPITRQTIEAFLLITDQPH